MQEENESHLDEKDIANKNGSDELLSSLSDEFLQGISVIKNIVEENGHAIVSDTESSNPFTMYTVGLARTGFPDVIISGNIPPEVAASAISNLVAEWKENGVFLGPNKNLFLDSKGEQVLAHIIPIHVEYAYQVKELNAMAIYYHINKEHDYPQGRDMVAAQIVWPDKSGFYPGFSNYDHEECKQEILFDPNIENKEV